MMKRFLLAGISVLASSAAFAASPSILPVRLCTGAEGFPYAQAGEIIRGAAQGSSDLIVEVVKNTGGSWSNIDRTFIKPAEAPDACDAAIVEPAALALLARQRRDLSPRVRKLAELHTEYAHVLCSRESGVTKLQQLRDNPQNYSVALGNNGSGAWLFWDGLKSVEPKFADVPVNNEGGGLALSAVATNSATCTIINSGLHGKTIDEANDTYGDKVLLVEADRSSFFKILGPDEKPIYTKGTIPGKTYRKIQDGFLSSSVDTVSWKAVLIVNSERVKNEAVLTQLNQAVNRSRAKIVADFGK
jgi:TRAP-type uncharacterized transport system substrate-binding protein